MATLQLLPSAYITSNEAVTVANPSNAYTDTSSSTYAQISTSRTYADRVWFYGFDFSQIPNDAIVTSMTFKIKASSTYETSSSRVQLTQTGIVLGQSNYELLTPTATTYTLIPTSWSYDDIIALGDDFAFAVGTATKNYTENVYGMQIDVTYHMPVPNKVDRIKDGVLTTLIDLTEDDITAADVAQGVTFHTAYGTPAEGTLGSAGIQTATYTPSSNSLTATFTVTKEPTFFICQLYFSSSDNFTTHGESSYLIYSVVGTSDSIYGVTGGRGSSTSSTYTIYSRSSSHLSWSCSGNTLTITSGSSTGAGYFRNGVDYILIYI